MKLPFTVEQFIGVFTDYNAATWPAPVLAHALGLAMLSAAFRRSPGCDRFISLGLAAMWAWTGIIYHAMFFSEINPAALLFGAAFVLQAGLLAANAFRGRVAYRPSIRGVRGRMAHLSIVFAMLVYPVLGQVSGHGYPNGPVFGLTPCPLVIFTFGMLLFTERTLPKYLVIVPMLWAVVGASAALGLGIREDIGLLVCGVVATTILVGRRRHSVTTEERDPARPVAAAGAAGSRA